MVKRAMTPRVGAGVPVDAILFEARLNGDTVFVSRLATLQCCRLIFGDQLGFVMGD